MEIIKNCSSLEISLGTNSIGNNIVVSIEKNHATNSIIVSVVNKAEKSAIKIQNTIIVDLDEL